MNTKYVARFPIFRGASRMRTGQEICVLRQGILSHFKNLLDIFAANGLFKDTLLYEGSGCIPPPPRCAPDLYLPHEIISLSKILSWYQNSLYLLTMDHNCNDSSFLS